MYSVKMTKEEFASVVKVLSRFDDITDFTIVRNNQNIELVFETTVEGLRGLFKVDVGSQNV